MIVKLERLNQILQELELSPDADGSKAQGLQHILAYAWELRTSDPVRSESLARMVLTMLREPGAREIEPPQKADLRAKAHIYIANTLRIRGDLSAADDMLRRAETFLEVGSHSPLARAELLLIQAQMAREWRRFDEAFDKLDQVIAIYRWSGDEQKVGLALLTKVNLLYTSGRSEECIAYLDQAEQLLDFEEDPWSHFSVVQARALCMVDLGWIQETEELLPEVRRLGEQFGTPLEQTRVLWVEGMQLLAKDQVREAEDRLREARDGFMRHKIGIDAALVSLDLATLFLEAGRVAETRELAEEMLPIFESLDIRREAFAALILFHRAALREQATAGMARDIASFLKRTGTTPALKYEEPS